MDHAAHGHGHAHAAPARPAPALANVGFGFGVAALVCTATIKLIPLGFLFALIGVVLCFLGIILAAARSMSAMTAIAGIACCSMTIVFWLLAHNHVQHVLGGPDAWGWLL